VEEYPINNIADIETTREEATSRANDELQGGVESISFALKLGFATLPLILRLTSPPAPDVIIMSDKRALFGVEVTRVGWLRLNQVRSEAAKSGDNLVEIGESLLVDRAARRCKNATKGSRSGDFDAIRMPGERLIGAGLLASESWARSMSALRLAVERKKARLPSYRASINHMWLFLIADGMIANWEDILTRSDLSHLEQQTKAICTTSGFDQVLLWRDRHGAVSLLA
jgi:hypothetical protein